MNNVSYTILRIFVLIFLIGYFSIGLGGRFSGEGDEDFYPFFSWFLFDRVPQRVQKDYAITLLEVNGEKLNPPILFEKSHGVYNPSRSLAQYHQYIREFGVALMKKNNKQEINNLRRWLESNFLPESVVYEVDEVNYNPIERFNSGKVISSKSIYQFSYRKE